MVRVAEKITLKLLIENKAFANILTKFGLTRFQEARCTNEKEL